jgi:hypothetical protein
MRPQVTMTRPFQGPSPYEKPGTRAADLPLIEPDRDDQNGKGHGARQRKLRRNAQLLGNGDTDSGYERQQGDENEQGGRAKESHLVLTNKLSITFELGS